MPVHTCISLSSPLSLSLSLCQEVLEAEMEVWYRRTFSDYEFIFLHQRTVTRGAGGLLARPTVAVVLRARS